MFKRAADRARASKAWRTMGEHRDLAAYNRLLDDVAGTAKGPWGLTELRAPLSAHVSQRRRLTHARPSVVALGARDWEQYGLWQAFESACCFTLVPYGHGNAPRSESLEACAARTSESFLRQLDDIARSRPVELAYFYASGAHLSDALFAELRRRGIWSVVMSLDDKHQFFRPRDPESGESLQLRAAARCDLYWTTWRAGLPLVRNAGGLPWYAPEAASPVFHRPLDVPRDLDVVFVGGAYGARADLVAYLRKRGFRVEAYGRGWPNGFVSFEQTVELFSRAKVVLGVGGVGHMWGVRHLKGRDFEVPMCGALYLTSYNPELADFFDIGREILCYSSFEECAEVLHWILRDDERAQSIRSAALARSRRDHTWEKRVAEMFELFPR